MASYFCMLLLCVMALIKVVRLQNSITGVTACTEDNFFFDSTSQACSTCPTNYAATDDTMNCVCPITFYLGDPDADVPEMDACTACTDTGTAPNLIQDGCKTCDAADVDDAEDCGCANNKYNSEFKDGDTYKIRCIDCPTGYFSQANSDLLYNCTICPLEGQTVDATTGACSCGTESEQQSFCIDTDTFTTALTGYEVSTGDEVRYNPVITNTDENGSGVSQSKTMEYLLPQALYECLVDKYYKQCQVLANLCVLQMYRESSAPCQALIDLAANTTNYQNDFYEFDGWKEGLPWIYYQKTGDELIHQSNRLKAKLSMEGSSSADSTRYSYIPFKLAKYAFDGTFMGWEDLSSQLFLCPLTEKESKKYRRVGLSLAHHCKFDLQKLVDRSIELPNLNYFFELFIEDYNGDLIDVPIKIDNYLDAADEFPNQAGVLADWKFVRRFFLYENISSIEDDYTNPTELPRYARFIREMRFTYEIDPDGDETVYVPYVRIYYKSVETAIVTESYPTDLVIVTHWFMESQKARDIEFGFFVATNILVGVWVVWKLIQWTALHPQNYESSTFLFYLALQAIYQIMEVWSSLMFWYLFLSSLIWTIIFKYQKAFYILLPDRYEWSHNYMVWEAIFGTVICLKILTIWSKIYYQCNVDVFFLDRERKKQELPDSSPNAWRLIFVANEYNEMQLMQYVSMEFTLIWFVFFMEGLGWRFWSAPDPDFTENLKDSVLNKYVMFCIILCTIFVIGFTQYIIKRLFSFLNPLAYHNFVDLCSITNISVFIFDKRIHGYYIHGESTGGQSDVSFKDLRSYLESEERGESRYRGLISEYPNLQTFEIFLPVKIRQLYELVYKQSVINEIDNFRQNMSAVENTSRLFNMSPLPKGLNINALMNQRDEMSQYFMNYISQVKNYPHIAIRERGYCQLFTEFPPDNMNSMETPVFIRDNWFDFRKVLFCNMDYDILILFGCMFHILDIWQINMLQSAIIIYTFYKIFVELPRKIFGSRNLSTKTLVESRFLL